MSTRLVWEIDGEKQLSRRLRKIGDASTDWTDAFKEAADKLIKIFSEDVFKTKGGKIGESWAPLKPKYLSQKVKAGYPSDILIKTGLMKSSFESNVGKDYAEIYNNNDYFKYHQSKDPRKKIPRRIMMKLDNPQKTLVVKVFQADWNKKVLKRYGFE